MHAFSTRTAFALAAGVFCLAGVVSAETVVGSGHVISETRTVAGFHGVTLAGSGEVIVTQGDTEGLVIDAEDNLLPLIESTVGGDGVLHLGFKEHAGSIESKKEVVYKLAVKTLDRMEVAGSGNMHAATLSTEQIHLKLPGSGEIRVDSFHADGVTTELEGSGTVKLAGDARHQKVLLNGSGVYEAKDLKTDAASLEINGSGEGKVWANGSLDVEINGSGEVSYYGSPKVKKSVNGSGEVNALGAKNG